MSVPSTTVFLHAVGFTGESLVPVAERAGGSSVCLDVIGHGAAVPPDGYSYSGKDAAQRLLAQLPKRQADAQRFGFGHSGGGTVLMWMELLAPGTFDALFLYEPPARVLPPEAFGPTQKPTLAESVRYRRNRFVDHKDFESYLRVRQPYSEFREESLAAYVRSGIRPHADGGYSLACTPEFESMVYSTPDPELVERLGELTLPVLIARGERTADRFVMMCAAVTERIPNARLVVVPGVTHFGPMEDPGLVAEVFRSEVEDAMEESVDRGRAQAAS